MGRKKAGTAWRQYAQTGDGVHFPFGVPSDGEQRRINMLVEMNDRRKEYLGARASPCLLELAAEYESKNMPTMAREIRAEARKISRRKKNGKPRVPKTVRSCSGAADLRNGVVASIRL